MPKHICPTCGSQNTAITLLEFGVNVVFTCNHCNFRDVIYYGSSPSDALLYFKVVSLPPSSCSSSPDSPKRSELSSVRPQQNLGSPENWWGA